MRFARLLAAALGAAALLAWGLAPPARADVGTIQYDTGTLSFASMADMRTWGNRFDTAVGLNTFAEPVLATGTLSQVTLNMSFFGGSGFRLSVFGPPVGTTAPLLRTTFAAIGSGSGWVTVPFVPPVMHTGGTFLVGVYGLYFAGPDAVYFDNNTTLGQGNHGIVINAGGGGGLMGLSANAVLRATGNLLPPELVCDPIALPAEVKPSIKLKFNKPTRDAWSLKIKDWTLPGGTMAAGAVATVTLGGNAVTGTLDAKGRFKGVDEQIKLKQAKSGAWKLSAKRKKRDMAADFADETLVDEDNPKPGKAVMVRAEVDLDGACHEADVPMLYKSKLGKSGKAKP